MRVASPSRALAFHSPGAGGHTRPRITRMQPCEICPSARSVVIASTTPKSQVTPEGRELQLCLIRIARWGALELVDRLDDATLSAPHGAWHRA